MATLKPLYGSSGQAFTLTLTSLATGSSRASTAVDNTSALNLDAFVSLTIKTGAASTSATGYVSIYAYGTVDGGTTYSDGVTGSDAAFTPVASGANLRLIGTYMLVANATTYQLGPMSVANAFGGVLPQKWGIVVTNNTGGTLDGTVASAEYQGVQGQSA